MLVLIAHVHGIKGMQVHLWKAGVKEHLHNNLTQQQFNLKSYHLFYILTLLKADTDIAEWSLTTAALFADRYTW